MNGGQYYWMARALRMIQPVEDILLDGEISKGKADSPKARVRFFRHPEGTVLFVADYGTERVDLKLSEKVATDCEVMDLDTEQRVASIGPTNGAFTVTLDEDRVRLLFIGTKDQWQKVRARRSH